MSLITEDNLGSLFKFLFSKSIIKHDDINFDDKVAFKTILELFNYDYKRYFNESNLVEEEKLTSRIELIGILLYRVARYYYLANSESVAGKYSNLGRLISGFEIYFSADIGKGLKINHGLGTVIGARCKIGDNLLIHQNVTLGDKNNMRPTIMNNVIIYSGAKILGGINIGNNAIIGANAVCMENVPDNSIAVGVPVRILK